MRLNIFILWIIPSFFILSACESSNGKQREVFIDVNTATYEQKYNYIINSLTRPPTTDYKTKALEKRREYLSFQNTDTDSKRDQGELPRQCLDRFQSDVEIAGCVSTFYQNGLITIKRNQEVERNGLIAENVFDACQYQGLFYSLAAMKGMNGIDTGYLKKYGKALKMSEVEIDNVVNYLHKNQDEAIAYQQDRFTSGFIQVCMLNPQRYVPTYSRIFN
ncbi:hypothetical protein [Serratia marcescens]|uniref:hypothetical protein n=1 Tax=Serratia marcescens TaxID=615 RepID=UPI001BD53BA8|nr:hypothetical protein [Serratia marcescens]